MKKRIVTSVIAATASAALLTAGITLAVTGTASAAPFSNANYHAQANAAKHTDAAAAVERDSGNGDGVTVVQSSFIQAPWAKDASGKSLPTSYKLIGNTLTQTVNTVGAKYPVVADPHYTWGWVTGTIYFSKVETADFAIYASVGLTGLGIVSGALAATGVGALLLPYLWTYGLSWFATAGIAINHNQCLSIKLPIPFAGRYSGGYCR